MESNTPLFFFVDFLVSIFQCLEFFFFSSSPAIFLLSYNGVYMFAVSGCCGGFRNRFPTKTPDKKTARLRTQEEDTPELTSALVCTPFKAQ